MRLSNCDLGVFFFHHHHALATALVAIADRLAPEPEDATHHDPSASLARAGRVARSMGADHGLYAYLLPSAIGDPPGPIDLRSVCLIREMLGYVNPLADAIFAVQGLGTFPIVLAGTPHQRARILPSALTGDSIGAFALTEPDAGSDVAALATTARREGDDYVLDGEKTFISNAGIATHYVVFATVDAALGRRGITAFLVDHLAPGLQIKAIPLSGDHPLGTLQFTRCRVPASALLGEVGGGFRLAMQTLDMYRVTVGAAAVGMARRALDESVKRARERKQFGKPIAENQTVQNYLAEMATELEASRLLVYRAAHLKDTGASRISTEAAMAKMYATEAAQGIIDKAVQIFGGLGVVRGQVVERLYRDIRPLRIYEGTTEIQKLIIAKDLLSR